MKFEIMDYYADVFIFLFFEIFVMFFYNGKIKIGKLDFNN